MVFVGVATYRRPDYLQQVTAAIGQHLPGVVLSVVHDGPADFDHPAMICLPARSGVAAVKNELLRHGLDSGADWLIIAEDDVTPTSALAVDGYIAAAEQSGLAHLSFHAHGPANQGKPRGTDPSGTVTFWPNAIGAWCLYSRRSIVQGGMFDERFHNAWEHVEHTLRLARMGFTSTSKGLGDHWFADATGSEGWLAEIPGSIANSAIRMAMGDEQLRRAQREGREYWRDRYPDTYQLVFGR